MGEVYRAHDARLERDVAIKTLLHAGGESAAERFVREARALATVNHPNVCQIYEIGEADGLPFIAMELLEGEPLGARLARLRLSASEAIDVALQVLGALQALHAKKLVHRDVKPSNVFLTAHGVKLLDFGLVRRSVVSSSPTATGLTRAGTILGTPRYMAPEQIQGRLADARTDLFAVAVILFEMLSGVHPFPGDSEMALLHAIVAEQPRMLTGSAWAEDVDRMLRRALAKNPADRYPSAERLAQDLRRVLPLVERGDGARAGMATRVAVLPFQVRPPDPDVEFVAAGLVDAIAAVFSREESLVMRSTMLNAAAADVSDWKRITDVLDVDIVLSGTIVRSGDRLRCTTQLLAAGDAKVLWSGTSLGTMADLPSLESALVAAVMDGLTTLGILGRGPSRPDALHRMRSLAVLPLENLSGDPGQDYFAEGLTEALITDLARLSGLSRVIARSSVMRFKRTELTLAQIATQLKVDGLVTGAVVRAGNRVRITAQLVEPSTEEQLWAGRYERDLRDILSLQNEVLRDIAAQIKVTLSGGEQERLGAARPVHPDAYEACLKGELHCDRLSLENARIALDYFNQALEKDPECARAYSGISRAWSFLLHVGLVPRSDVPPEAWSGNRTAIALDPMLVEAYYGLATQTLYFDWDWEGAQRVIQRALEVNPNYAKSYQVYADVHLVMGRRADALAALERSLELDPLDFWLLAAIGGRLLRLGRWEDAVAQLQKAHRGDPTLSLAHQYLCTAFDQREMFDKAVEHARTCLDLRGQPEAAEALARGHRAGGYHQGMRLAAAALADRATRAFIQPTQIAALYAYADEPEAALQWLQRGYDDRDSWMVFLKDDSRFESLRGRREFQSLLSRMKFPDG